MRLFLAPIFTLARWYHKHRSAASFGSTGCAFFVGISCQLDRSNYNKMVVHCQWGTCTGDKRYPAKIVGGKIHQFPSVKSRREDAMAWIKACCRPHDQLNLDLLNKNRGICTGHFVGGAGPTKEHPYPIPADGSQPHKSRPQRKYLVATCKHEQEEKCADESMASPMDSEIETGTYTQTDEMFTYMSPMDLLALTAELEAAKLETKAKMEKIHELEEEIKLLKKPRPFSVEAVNNSDSKIKNLFQFYTGITHMRFLALLAFLLPSDENICYEGNRKDTQQMSTENGLFLTLCRLQQNFAFPDLAMRFDITKQSAGVIFSAWIEKLYRKLCTLTIWPSRQNIIENMPAKFRLDFPTTLIIIDGTELKTESPWAHGMQSQLYSDYKSTTTFKGLIGCDSRGSLMFVSELFTGSISDKSITKESGFYDTVKKLKKKGYVEDGDAVMADKGFTIHDELKAIGLSLNIPPFSAAGKQMSQGDLALTDKIASHRIHVERLISRVKDFKILSNRIPAHLFPKLNEVWTVCCYLTLFQGYVLQKK